MSPLYFRIFRTAVAALAATATLANTAQIAAPAAMPAVGSGIGTSISGVLQVTVALGLVLVAIFATAWLLRRMGVGQMGQAGHLRLVSGIAVGPKERVVIVEVQDTWLVLGVTAVEITQLHSLPKPEVSAASQPLSQTFAERLAQVIIRHKSPTTMSAAGKPGEERP